jgi:AbrB family looped-hinge helix DNA binding protein
MANTVGAKGQVVIEKPIREALCIEPGSVAIQTLKGDHVEIRFYPPEHNRSLLGALAHEIQRKPGDRDWNELQEGAWRDAWVEKEKG